MIYVRGVDVDPLYWVCGNLLLPGLGVGLLERLPDLVRLGLTSGTASDGSGLLLRVRAAGPGDGQSED